MAKPIFMKPLNGFIILKSDEQLYTNKENQRTIQIEFDYIDMQSNDIDKLSKINKTKIQKLLGNVSCFIIGKTSANHKRIYIVNGEKKANPSGIDTVINEFLPRLEYVSTKIKPEDISQYKGEKSYWINAKRCISSNY